MSFEADFRLSQPAFLQFSVRPASATPSTGGDPGYCRRVETRAVDLEMDDAFVCGHRGFDHAR
jgi:hypothetical protein